MLAAPAFEAARAAGAALLLRGSTVEIAAPESVDERTLDAVAAIVARHKTAVVAALRAEAESALTAKSIAPRPKPKRVPSPAPGLDLLNRAGVRLPKLPGSGPIVAAPRSTWGADVAAALDRLGYPHARVVLLSRRYPPGDPAMADEAARRLKQGEAFEGTAAVSTEARWFAPVWPEQVATASGMVRCRDCSHYRPDPLGAGGIGTCSVEGEGTAGKPLYPRALRRCGNHAEVAF